MLATAHSISRCSMTDRKSTRLNSSHTDIYTLSLHDALPIYVASWNFTVQQALPGDVSLEVSYVGNRAFHQPVQYDRSEEHTSELQSHRYIHSFPPRRSSDLRSLVELYRSTGAARGRIARGELCWQPRIPSAGAV